MGVETTLRWDKIDKDGKVLIHGEEKEANSYVIAFLDDMARQMGQQTLSIKDTGNSSRSIGPSVYVQACTGSAGITAYGLVFGTGSAVVALTDYALQALIAHGTGSGQLSYGSTTANAPTTSGTTRRFTVVRSVTNNSGGTITVNEVGIYVLSSSFYFCSDRTLSTQAIANGESWALTYTLGVTV